MPGMNSKPAKKAAAKPKVTPKAKATPKPKVKPKAKPKKYIDATDREGFLFGRGTL